MMSREARKLSKSGMYHIIFRAKEQFFKEDKDYIIMLDIIKYLKQDMKFEIYAYSLMKEHVHILLQENSTGQIMFIMRRLLTKYVKIYNSKYCQKGSVILDRYKSEPVDIIDDKFFSILRYIHQEPLKEKLVDNISQYKWVSYREYIELENDTIINKDRVLNIMNISDFIEFHKNLEEQVFELNIKKDRADEVVYKEILNDIKIDPNDLYGLERSKRDEILRVLKQRYSLRQIERLTGISRSVIHKT